MARSIDKLLSLGRLVWNAGSALSVLPPPKVKAKQQSYPTYIKSTTVNKDVVLPQEDRRLANLDIGTFRSGNGSRAVLRDLIASNPDLSAAVNAYIRTAITTSYTGVARNPDGTFNREATSLLQQLLVRMDTMQDYSQGFSNINTLRSVAEAHTKELMSYGSCACELVLGKDRLPQNIAPLSTTTIKFSYDGDGLLPKQVIAGETIELDIPTFFYTALDQDLTQPYSSSPLEPAIQPVLFATDFMNDLRRVVKRAIHPRLNVVIDEEKFRKWMPAEAKKDEASIVAHMNSAVSEIESRINQLNPEDAIVYFNSLDIGYIDNGKSKMDKEYTVLQGIADSKVATGAKAMPSILGHGTGTQNVASTEAMLFMKSVEGVQEKLNEMYSRVFTLAVRLFGFDVYVVFKYDSIDLRPKAELEAFRVMRQSRLLELLSHGFITDDEASVELTGQLTPPGFKPLSGTQFLNPPTDVGNPYNGAGGKAGGGAGGGGPVNQDTKSKAPAAPKGPQKKAFSVVGGAELDDAQS